MSGYEIRKYINKETGENIPELVYNQLTVSAKDKYISYTKDIAVVEHHHHEDGDHLSVGDGIACIVALPIIALFSLF